MSYRFIHITEEYNDELLKLFHTADPGANAFHISRGNNFFALPDEFGKATYYGIIKNDQLVAVVGITEQNRYIRRKVQKTFYMHDLRMHPVHGSAMVYYRLIEQVKKIYEKRSDCKWIFSVILEANPNIAALTKGKTVFPQAATIGTMVHTGFPLFCGAKKFSKNIIEIDKNEAWDFYSLHAPQVNFALADERHFKSANGSFIGIKENGKLVAIAKITDQQNVRQIIASGPLTRMQKIVNVYCHIKKCKPFPDQNEIFQHCYLSYYTAVSKENFRNGFIAYIRKHYSNVYTYVFTGFSPLEAINYKGIFLIRFNSSIVAYGETTALTFQFPELTLI